MSEHPRLNGSGQSTPAHDATPPILDDVEIIDSPWPTPTDIENPPLPTVDLSLLTDWHGDFTRALSASTETPPELAVSMTLAMCATACQRRLRVQASGDHIEPCNLWLMVVMPSGSRKSAVLVKSVAPAIEWEHYQAEILKPEILQATSERKTAEARVKALRASAANPKTKEIEISRLTD